MYNIKEITSKLNVGEAKLADMIGVSHASVNNYKRAEYANGFVGGIVERNLIETFGEVFLDKFKDNRMYVVGLDIIQDKATEDDIRFITMVEDTAKELDISYADISRGSGYGNRTLPSCMSKVRNGGSISEKLKSSVEAYIQKLRDEKAKETPFINTGTIESGSEGAVVQFYKHLYDLSKPYVVKTNSIKVQPGDSVVVATTKSIGVAVVSELCKIKTPGNSHGIIQKVEMQ